MAVLIYLCITLIWLGGITARYIAESVINDGINCQNGGTRVNKYTCVCPGGLFGRDCNHSLYLSFDTLENLTLMQGSEGKPFIGQVQGRVNSAVSLNRAHRQSIDLGFHPEVCLSHKYGCGDEGAAISFWLKIPDCRSDGIITTVQGFTGLQASGFSLYCLGGLRFLLLVRGDYFHTDSWPINTTDWIHVVFNFHGRNKSPGYGFYYDGERQTSETQKLYHRQFPKPYHRTARDGRIFIGRADADRHYRYGTFVIDELLFFNNPVTEPEIKMLSK